MRLVLDTNVVIAGLLWDGPPHRLLECAIDAAVTLYSSPALVDELAHALTYAKFNRRIAQGSTTSDALVLQYSAMATLLSPLSVARVIANDPDDDHVLACALAAQADLIVSGDEKHFRPLGGQYQGIPILSPALALQQIAR